MIDPPSYNKASKNDFLKICGRVYTNRFLIHSLYEYLPSKSFPLFLSPPLDDRANEQSCVGLCRLLEIQHWSCLTRELLIGPKKWSLLTPANVACRIEENPLILNSPQSLPVSPIAEEPETDSKGRGQTLSHLLLRT